MRRNILPLLSVAWSVLCLCGCSSPSGSEKPLVLKDPALEKRAEYLREKITVHTGDTVSRVELGRIYLSEGMFDRAIREFEEVLLLDPRHIQAHLLLSLALQKQPKPDLPKAVRVLESAAEVDQHNADVHLNLAHVYDKLKEDAKAVGEFERVIELSKDPATLVSTHLGLMAIYKRQGKSEKAAEHYQAAYQIYPGVEDMIKQAVINQVTPAPRYVGGEFREDTGTHPSLETRIERAQQEITKIEEDKNE